MNDLVNKDLSEDSLRTVLQAAPVAIVAVDLTGKISFVNRKLCDLFNYDSDELLGVSVDLLLPANLRDRHVLHRRAYADNPHERPMGSGLDLCGQRKDGSVFPLEAGLTPLELGNRRIILSTIIDISHRKQVENTLEQRVIERTQELEQRRHIADSMRDILSKLNANESLDKTLQFIVDRAGPLLHAEGSAIFLLDDKQDNFAIRVSFGLSEIYTRQAKMPHERNSLIKQALSTRQTVCISNLNETNLGDTLGYQTMLVVPLMVNNEEYGGLTTYYARERTFVDEELELAMTFGTQISLAIQNSNLRTRSQRQAVTDERNRIARDLHDSVTQTLFSASMIADVLPQLWAIQPREGERRMKELGELTRGALAEMRTLLLELRPATLRDVTLPELLQQLIDGVAARGKLEIDFSVTGQCNLPIDIRVAFFRTAQEAMNNIAKHSQASYASVTLAWQPESTDMIIIDNGCGFKLDTISSNHLGLSIMRERAAEIDGTLTIESDKPVGTTVRLRWERKDR